MNFLGIFYNYRRIARRLQRRSQQRSTFSLNVFIVSFIGAYCSQLLWHELPTLQVIVTWAIALTLVAYYNNNASLSLGVLFAIVWSASVGYWHLHWQLQDVQFQQDVTIVGQITEVDQTQQRTRIQLAASQIAEQSFFIPRQLRLNWYQAGITLEAGDHIRLIAKLKPAHGLGNPFTFNYERWLLSNNIRATGSVVSKSGVTITPRQISIRDRLIQQLQSYQFAQQRWLLALTFGHRSELVQQDWQLLRDSGLSHLFAISGLHLASVIAILWFVLGQLTLLLSRLDVVPQGLSKFGQFNFNYLIFIILISFCAGYAYLAGWQIPVVRAWCMLVIGLVFVMLRIRLNLWQLIAMVMVLLMLLMPFSIYSNSFWLSIIAVVIIAFYLWRWPSLGASTVGKALALIRLQLLLTVGMLPLIISQFGHISFAAVGLNLIAVPLISLLIVPLCLVAVVLMLFDTALDFYFFWFVDAVLAYFFEWISWVVAFDYAAFSGINLSSSALLSLSLVILILLLPRFVCQYRVGLLLAMPLLIELADLKSPASNWQVHVIDVGQGTAVLVTQDQQALLVDTGAFFPSGFNMGEAVVLPVIQGLKIQHLDFLIVSHADNDHAGSRHVISRNIKINNTIDYNNCKKGQLWQWHALSIEVLWPSEVYKQNQHLSENNRSCVVRVSDGHRAVLFSGDIEKATESLLVESLDLANSKDIKADILLAPHHGSKTSSSLVFLRHVDPQLVVFTTGYLNRWGFPHLAVRQRYGRLGVTEWNTATSGYVRFDIPYAHDLPIAVVTWRQDLHRRWY